MIHIIVGIGCDICELLKIKKIINSNVLEKIFSKQELLLCSKMNNKRKIEWLAGRFAAKEAIYKAINIEFAINFNEIEILYTNNIPSCYIEDYKINLSISHDGEYAIAYAIVFKDL